MLAFRSIVVILIGIYLATTTGCVTCRPVSIQSAADVSAAAFDPKKEYRIDFDSGRSYRVKGDRLTTRDGLIGVQFDGESEFRYYQTQQIKELCRQDISVGRTAGLAAGITAGVVGLLVGIVIIAVGSAQK